MSNWSSRDVTIGVSGEALGGVGLALAGVVATLLAIPLYKRAVTAIWEHQHAQAQARIESHKTELKRLIAQATHAKTQAARYKR
jgi:NAD(P)H-hydrate repair Nnr-like enzyme with NAD(P)H-hydrate dehydratase domain